MATRKFAVGQTVHFVPDRRQLSSARGRFKVVRLLPEDAMVVQYRLKSQADGHERIAREDQLTRS